MVFQPIAARSRVIFLSVQHIQVNLYFLQMTGASLKNFFPQLTASAVLYTNTLLAQLNLSVKHLAVTHVDLSVNDSSYSINLEIKRASILICKPQISQVQYMIQYISL